ncbi:MAG: hypothetical protein U5L96_16730 [Owenweeksia sp.]|nr:hypothetical protein [Owenweeksia sp.]
MDAGTYADTCTIDSTVFICGPNYGINPNTGSRVAEAIVYPAISNPDPTTSSVVLFYLMANASGTEIDGLTLDGDNPGLTSGVVNNGADVDAIEAISSYEGVADVSITNNIIKQVSYAAIDLYNYNNGGAATSNNLVANNLFQNIMPSGGFGLGILIYNNCYTTIRDNVMDEVRVGIQTGNFYQADPGNSHAIYNNQVHSARIGIWHNLTYQNASTFDIYDNDITTATGFGFDNQGLKITSQQGNVGVNVWNNTVTGAPIGIDLWNNPTSNTVTVGYNQFIDCDTAIFANNYDGYSSDANSSSYVIDSVDVQNAKVALLVKDNASNSNGATVSVEVLDSSIFNSTTGIVIEGGGASVSFYGSLSTVLYGSNRIHHPANQRQRCAQYRYGCPHGAF